MCSMSQSQKSQSFKVIIRFPVTDFQKERIDKMTFKTAVDNLVRTYEKYGFSRSEIESQMKDGIMNQGFSVNVAYNGIRMALAHVTGEHEYFSIEDMMEITGESREEVLKQVEDMRLAAVAAGENPDDYAVPVERKILYFPDGFTS